MIAEKEYIKEKLMEIGIRIDRIYTALKKMKLANDAEFAGILANGETFRRTNDRKPFTDENGQKKIRIKNFAKETNIRVVLANRSDMACETLLDAFLKSLDNGFYLNGNWIGIEVKEADWVEEEDSILKAKIAVQMDVTFKGGVYRDGDMKQAKLGSITIS